MSEAALTQVSDRGALDGVVGLAIRSRSLRRAILSLPARSKLRRAVVASVVRWGYARFNETGKLPRRILDGSMEFEQAAAIIDTAGTFHGIEGFEAMLGELRAAFGDIRFEPESMVILEQDEILIRIRFVALGTGSGLNVDRGIAHLLTVRRGAVVKFKVFWEPEEALEAAGLSE